MDYKINLYNNLWFSTLLKKRSLKNFSFFIFIKKYDIIYIENKKGVDFYEDC